MHIHSRKLGSSIRLALQAGAALTSLAFVIVACGSSSDSKFGDPDAGGPPNFENDGSLGDAKPDGGDPFANDPPPKYCVLPGQPTPPMPGGTVECPDDKNKPGCGCTTLGEEAACWTGLRVNRNLGVCKDGRTKCVQLTENTKAWGPCEGEVLPTAGETKGKPACKCFSEGQWKLANLSPCFVEYNGDPAQTYAVSTAIDPADGKSKCPTIPQAEPAPPVNPNLVWTTDTLKVDCAGHFKVCYELKAGSYDAPLPTDCSLTGKLCVEADYPQAGVDQPFPDLPRWNSTDTACAVKWKATGGYGEMTVIGESVLCDKIDDGAGNSFVFNRVRYCPSKCQDVANAADPDCQNCQQGGSGTF